MSFLNSTNRNHAVLVTLLQVPINSTSQVSKLLDSHWIVRVIMLYSKKHIFTFEKVNFKKRKRQQEMEQ